MCVSRLYKKLWSEDYKATCFLLFRIQWCFFNHTDNLDSSEESEVENSEKRKGNEHLQERYLSMKWIG